MTDVCEMREGFGWVEVDIEDAVGRPGEVMRCVACHRRVKAFRAYNTGTRAHFAHAVLHRGCPTKPSFNGRLSRHPQALT